MKKVSTVAAKTSGKISLQKLTIGVDLGDRSSTNQFANQILVAGLVVLLYIVHHIDRVALTENVSF